MPKSNQSSGSRSAPSEDAREQRYQRKLLRNRVSAQRSRDRKKKALDALEVEVHDLKQRNLELVAQVGDLETKAEVLAAQLGEKDATIQKLLGVIHGLTAPQEAQAAPPAPMETAVSADAGVTFSWGSLQQEHSNQASPVAQQQEPVQDGALNDQDNGLPVLGIDDILKLEDGDFFMFDDVHNGYEFDPSRPKC